MNKKVKTKPNNPIGFINCTQKQEKERIKEDNSLSLIKNGLKRVPQFFHAEEGITLIALIIMVILLILLAMVSIKAVTGKEGILASSSNIANEYVIQQYGEQIEQLVHSIILKDSLMRKNNNKRKYGRRNGKRRLDKKCSAR